MGVFIPLPILQMEPEALCFEVVRPSVRVCLGGCILQPAHHQSPLIYCVQLQIVISGLESLDAAAAAAADWVYNDEDGLSESADEAHAADASSVSVAFHCYHSLPSAEWSDHIQVCIVVSFCFSVFLL